MMNATSPTAAGPPATPTAAGTEPPKPLKKKFQNGWTKEIEALMAEWADKAVCYRWMHERAERIYYAKDLGFMFPVIILSTITGAANFALDSVIQDPEHKKYAQLGLGGLSIFTGIISTIANRLGYGSRSESHKSAGLSWGKFQRLIAIELSLHPDERSDCMHFLKMCRTELDRLIEQSPTLPDDVINACRAEFAKYPGVRKPEIVGDIKTTSVFVDTNARAKKLAQEAALMIAQKKGTLKQIVLDDLEPRIQRVLEHSTLPAIREELRGEVRLVAEKATREAVSAVAAGRVTAATATGGGSGLTTTAAAVATEAVAARTEEVQQLAMSGVVRAMRERLAAANAKTGGPAPAGIGSLFARLPDASGAAGVPVAGPDVILHVAEGDDSSSDDDDNAKE
jgi:hypothetical protein